MRKRFHLETLSSMFQPNTQKSYPSTLPMESTNLNQVGRLQWPTRLQSRFRDTGEEKHGSAAPATYKGEEVRPPQLGNALDALPPASRRVKQPCDTVTKSRNARLSRRWHSLPPLPEEEAPKPPPKDDTLEVEGAPDDLTDTEAVLRSLRPERLSLHHIKLPHHAAHDLVSTDNGHSLTDSHSSHTRMQDIQVCHMGDPGVGKRNEQQKQLAKRQERGEVIRHEVEYGSASTNETTLYRLPEEDASPERIFYTSLIDIVKTYYKEMSGIVQQSHETGQISDDHWLREKWRHMSAMDKRLLAAERASGYKVIEPRMRSERIH